MKKKMTKRDSANQKNKKKKNCCCKLADLGNRKKKQAGRLIANFQIFCACLGL